MPQWQQTLNLLPEWKQAENETISPQEMSRVIATRLRALPPVPGEPDGRQSLADQFEALADDPLVDFDDMDAVLTELYDWADSPLDRQWNGKKLMWIKTF